MKKIKSVDDLIREIHRIYESDWTDNEQCEECEYDNDCIDKGCYILRAAVEGLERGAAAEKDIQAFGEAVAIGDTDPVCGFCKHDDTRGGCELLKRSADGNELDGDCHFDWRGVKKAGGQHG